MNEFEQTMKMVKWAYKRGACLIKVGNVELTFPLDVSRVPHSVEQGDLRNDMGPLGTSEGPLGTTREASLKAEAALRSAMSSDALHQIEDQEKWFHNNRPPQI